MILPIPYPYDPYGRVLINIAKMCAFDGKPEFTMLKSYLQREIATIILDDVGVNGLDNLQERLIDECLGEHLCEYDDNFGGYICQAMFEEGKTLEEIRDTDVNAIVLKYRERVKNYLYLLLNSGTHGTPIEF